MFDDEVDEDNNRSYEVAETVMMEEKGLDSVINRRTDCCDDDEILTDPAKSTTSEHFREAVVEDQREHNFKGLLELMGKSSVDSYNQDLKLFTSLFSSKQSFNKYYKNIYLEKENIKCFYLKILVEMEKTIRLGETDEFINICKIIDYINEIENKIWLKEFYDNERNPIKETNLIILASKYNNVKILQHLFHNENGILHNFTTAIKRNVISPRDQDNSGCTAFYYAIRNSNINILKMLINEWPCVYFKNSTNLLELDYVISSAYSKLKLVNVLLSKEMQFFVENKLINLRFFCNNHNNQNVQSKLGDITERISLVLKSNDLLKTEYLNEKEVDEKFTFLIGFAAQNINVLKRQLKSTYDRLPWEEIEFCLICFASSHINHKEINLIYKSVLTKERILSHLDHFVTNLIEEKDKIKKEDINNSCPKLKRENAIKNIVCKYQPFSTLYNDFERIRDDYSLRKILNYIEFALLSNPKEIKGQLVIERTLLVTGEYLKNTLESPNLSYEVSEILLTCGLQNDTIAILRSIRNSLSHSYSLSKRMETEKTSDVFNIIQSDLKKVKTEITEILLQNKLRAIKKIIRKILDCQNFQEILKLINIYRYTKIDKINLENSKSSDHEMVEKLVKELKQKINNKTYQQEKIFKEIDAIINNGKKEFDSSNHNFNLGFAWLSINKINYTINDMTGIKYILKNILDIITPKIGNKNLEKVTYLSSRLFNVVKRTHKKEKIQKLLHKSSLDFKNISELSIRFLKDPMLRELNDYDKIKQLIFKIAHSAHFKVDQVKGLEALKVKYDDNKRKKDYFNNKDEIENTFSKRLQTLSVILSFIELKSSNLFEFFNFYENDKSLQVATEMLVFDLIEILKNCLANNHLLFDNPCPLLIGKSLRNHLAHGNSLVDISPYDPTIAIFCNSIKFIKEICISILKNNLLIGQPISDNTSVLKEQFDNNLNLIINQKEMFDALQNGNSEKIKECINKGVEIKSMDVNKKTSLHFAASGGNIDIVKFLVENGLDINSKDINGQNSLYMAVSNGRMDIVKFFIEQLGLSIDNVDNDGTTLLHIAAKRGHKDIVKYLLHNNANTFVKDNQGFAPVHLAIINNNKDTVKILLNKEPNLDLNKVKGGFTSLHIAAEHGHLHIVDYLIERNADVNAKNDNNWIPLHAAALNGYPMVVKTLILNGANVNTKAINGCTPLHYAVENGSEDVIKILLEYGANINNVDNTFHSSALHYVSKVGMQNIAEILLKNNANVNIRTITEITPLHFAAQNGHLEIVQTLIRRKAKLNAKNNKGATPLHLAIQGNYVKVVESLLTKGANVHSQDDNNFTPLHVAVVNGNKIIIDTLVKWGPNIDAISNDDQSPLHLAIESCQIQIVKMLIENGADCRRTGKNNLTPIHLAALNGFTDIVEILLKKNCPVDSIAYEDGNILTPLHYAAKYGHLDTVKILIENGANSETKSCSNFTPLLSAIESGSKEVCKYLLRKAIKIHESYICCAIWQCDIEIVEMLIENGGKPTNQHLFTAILAGYSDIVKILIKNKVSVNEKYKNITPLTLAALNGNKEIVKILLDSGADIKIEYSLNPLYSAAYNDHVEIAKLLIKKGAEVNAQSDDGMTALHIAAEEGCLNVVEMLLENGAKMDIKNNKNRTPLELAVLNNCFPVIKKLLQHMKGVINAKGNDNWSLLHIAAQAGNSDIVKYLINKGADIEAKNAFGLKPIHIAAEEGHRNIIDLFLSKGLTINEVSVTNKTMLHYATLKGQVETAKYLIEKNIDVNAKDVYGKTALHNAAEFSHKEIVQVLLDNSAIYNAVDKFYCTPKQLAKNRYTLNILESTKKLFKLVKFNKYLEVEHCIRAGACVNARNTIHVTPLFYAAWKGYNEIVNTLLQNKANPNIIGKKGYSPMHYAVKFSHLEIVKSLLANGAIYNAMDNYGKIPLDFAENKPIINLLKLIDKSYEDVQCCNLIITDVLDFVKDVDILKSVMNTQNRERKSLIVTAMHNNFPKVENLKQLLQENVSLHIHRANLLLSEEKYQEALDIFKKIFHRRKEIFGLDSPSTLEIQNHIAMVLYKQTKYQEALKLLNEIYFKQINILGLNYKDTLNTRSYIGLVLHRLGNNEEALLIYEDVYEKQKEILGFSDKHTLDTRLQMALVLDDLERFDEALIINQEVFKRSTEIWGINSAVAISALNNIAMVLSNQNKYEEALKIYNEVYELKKQVLGPHHSTTIRTLHNIGTIFWSLNKIDEALDTFNKVFDIQKSTLGWSHRETLHTQYNIANLLFSQGEINGALKMYTQCFHQKKEILGENHPYVLKTIKNIQIINDIFKLKGRAPSYNFKE